MTLRCLRRRLCYVDSQLEVAVDPWGARRFYPPGSHPAIWKEKALVKELEAVKYLDRAAEAQVREALDYHQERIAAFEEGESLAKQHYLARSAAS